MNQSNNLIAIQVTREERNLLIGAIIKEANSRHRFAAHMAEEGAVNSEGNLYTISQYRDALNTATTLDGLVSKVLDLGGDL